MWVLLRVVIKAEHSVKRFHEELHLIEMALVGVSFDRLNNSTDVDIGCEEHCETKVVSGI